MKIVIFILLEIVSFKSLFSQVNETEYESNFSPYGLSTVKLILNSDSSFIWKMKIEFGGRTFNGSWEKKNDTLYLQNKYINIADDPFNQNTDSIIMFTDLT